MPPWRALARTTIPGLLLVVPAAPRVWEAAVRAAWSTLGRDQGIFQYVGWAVGKGEVAYRDVRDVNGPLVPLLHLALQALGGTDEHRFRLLDLLFSAVAFAFVGACLVDLDRADEDGRRGAERLVDRAASAAAAMTALGAQYLAYGYWDTAQRESFFDWFVLGAIGAALVGQRALLRGRGAARAATLWLGAAGALSTVSWLGKPTYALFTVAHVLALLVDDLPSAPRLRRLAPFLAGGALGLAVPLAFLIAAGDVGAWARITFVDVPAMYRFIWPRPLGQVIVLPGYDRTIALAVVSFAGVVALVAGRVLPRRALPIALLPAFGLASVVAQAKGFPYHFHPVTLGTTLALLAALRAVVASSLGPGGRVAALLGASALALGLGLRARQALAEMPWWPEAPPTALRTPAALDGEGRLAPFARIDFFPYDLRRGAAFVAERTAPDDRVQMYGMDAYFLFLARRKSATPFIYAYDLNVDAALAGAAVYGGAPPRAAERARIRTMRDAHERDMLAQLERVRPAAFVFVDQSPLMSNASARVDFEAHCPDAAAWVTERYREAAVFGRVHVWLRKDERVEVGPAR